MPEDNPTPALEEIDFNQHNFKEIIDKVNSGKGVIISGFPQEFHLRARLRDFNQYLINNDINGPFEQITNEENKEYDGKKTYSIRRI